MKIPKREKDEPVHRWIDRALDDMNVSEMDSEELSTMMLDIYLAGYDDGYKGGYDTLWNRIMNNDEDTEEYE